MQAVSAVGTTAIRLLRVHPLRTAGALQLGAEIVAAVGHRQLASSSPLTSGPRKRPNARNCDRPPRSNVIEIVVLTTPMTQRDLAIGA